MAPPSRYPRTVTGALTANAVQAAQPGTAMGISPAGATFVATAVRPAISANAIVTAQQGPAFNGAFGVRRALFAEPAIATPLTTAERTADTLDAIETATAV